jgi:hypothetical protein
VHDLHNLLAGQVFRKDLEVGRRGHRTVLVLRGCGRRLRWRGSLSCGVCGEDCECGGWKRQGRVFQAKDSSRSEITSTAKTEY